MTLNPENLYFKKMVVWVNSFEPQLCSHMDRAPDLGLEVGLALLQGFLDLACRCQDISNILPGRLGIQTLPREWVLERIESVAEPLLQSSDYEWWRLLDVYEGLDEGLTRRLALRAVSHPNPDIQEAGTAFLEG